MVYVDDFNDSHGFGFYHMVADTITELHTMARKIGVHKKYFKSKSRPHYDVTKAKKQLALKYGAKAMAARPLVRHLKATKAEGWSDDCKRREI